MIALFAVAALAADPGVPAAWDDALADRAPREPTVALGEALVPGDTTVAFSRLSAGLPLHRTATFGVGVAVGLAGHATFVPAEDRASFVPGNGDLEVHLWGAPRKQPGTYHDFVVLGGIPLAGSPAYFVKASEAVGRLGLGYSGYYETGAVDVALDGRLGVAAARHVPIWGELDLSVLWAPGGSERVAVVSGGSLSNLTAAAHAGARWRLAGGLELGAALVVPVRTSADGAGELPIWPAVDARWRFGAPPGAAPD